MALAEPDLSTARERLGKMWGLGRPLKLVELARLLRMHGRNAARKVKAWESGEAKITGPASVAIEAMLAGWKPTELEEILLHDV